MLQRCFGLRSGIHALCSGPYAKWEISWGCNRTIMVDLPRKNIKFSQSTHQGFLWWIGLCFLVLNLPNFLMKLTLILLSWSSCCFRRATAQFIRRGFSWGVGPDSNSSIFWGPWRSLRGSEDLLNSEEKSLKYWSMSSSIWPQPCKF